MQMKVKINNIALIGFMGTGKSTVGEMAAKKLGFQFADIDKVIEKRLNLSISEIFAEFGEQYFRKLEQETIKEYSEKSKIIIAKSNIIYRNIRNDRNRPLLANAEDPKLRIEELLKNREKYYKNNDYEIDVSESSVEQVADQVSDIYKLMSNNT